MAPTIIRKSFAVTGAQMKADADERGVIKGFAAAMGNMDSWGDVIMPGAFAGALARFLADGFVSSGHDWNTYIAMPTVAREEGLGLYTEAVFHSDDEAQRVRLRCQERMDHGLSVGLSIGFSIAKGGAIWFESGEAMLKHLSDMQVDLAGFDTESIRSYPYSCRLITSIQRLYEYSIVPVPANSKAEATDVKSLTDQKSLLAGLSLSDALETALAAVDELAERFGSYQALKDEQGRRASEDRLRELAHVHARLGFFLEKGLPPPDADEPSLKADELAQRTLAARTAAHAAGAKPQ